MTIAERIKTGNAWYGHLDLSAKADAELLHILETSRKKLQASREDLEEEIRFKPDYAPKDRKTRRHQVLEASISSIRDYVLYVKAILADRGVSVPEKG